MSLRSKLQLYLELEHDFENLDSLSEEDLESKFWRYVALGPPPERKVLKLLGEREWRKLKRTTTTSTTISSRPR